MDQKFIKKTAKIPTVQNETVKTLRQEAPPLRIRICQVDHPEAAYYIKTAESFGQHPYVFDRWVCVDFFRGGNVWRAPDAVFQRVPDGIYVFRDTGVY